MRLLSEEDLDLRRLTEEELHQAWDLWFDLAQATNEHDPPFSHGVFVLLADEIPGGTGAASPG